MSIFPMALSHRRPSLKWIELPLSCLMPSPTLHCTFSIPNKSNHLTSKFTSKYSSDLYLALWSHQLLPLNFQSQRLCYRTCNSIRKQFTLKIRMIMKNIGEDGNLIISVLQKCKNFLLERLSYLKDFTY